MSLTTSYSLWLLPLCIALGGVGGDGEPVDELHDDVGLPVGRDAAIEEGGDVLVIEVGEDLAFVAEAADGEVALEAAAEELEGDG